LPKPGCGSVPGRQVTRRPICSSITYASRYQGTVSLGNEHYSAVQRTCLSPFKPQRRTVRGLFFPRGRAPTRQGSRTDSRCEIFDLRQPHGRRLGRRSALVCRFKRYSCSPPISQDGRTALHWAAFSGAFDIAQYLLEQKAEVDKIDGGGWTALHIAGMPLLS